MAEGTQNIKLQKEKEEIVQLKESFHQLSNLQDECNEELSRFQKENFIVHEEFRATVAHLSEMIDNFSATINNELDKLALRISHLETIANYAFNLTSTQILYAPDANLFSRTSENIFIGFNDGQIDVFSLPHLKKIAQFEKMKYDPLNAYGKITQFYAFYSIESKFYIGFFSGMVIGFPSLTGEPIKMEYHKEPITALTVSDDLVASGDYSGIVPEHRLSIASIFTLNNEWVIADRTGIITVHNKSCSLCKIHYPINRTLRYLFPHHDNQVISIGDELLVWEGKKIVKTFNAVPIGNSVVCCKKEPELMLIGDKTKTELQLIFLDSLLFPKTINILDSPPVAISDYFSSFYVLTQSGKLYVIRPSGS